jgi:hypothetical protein
MHTELPNATALIRQVFSVSNTNDFEQAALAVFRFQYQNNAVYRSYCDALSIPVDRIGGIHQIPFLPISFFKTHNVICGVNSITGLVFESSGTTGMQPSRHLVPDKQLYEQSFRQTFTQFYGPVQDYCILGLLPSYLERRHSSLVYMVHDLITHSSHGQSGFYLYDFDTLAQTLQQLESAGQKTILFGVTYALLDFAEQHPMPLHHTIVVETGGMKGRKKELLRAEVHGLLKKSFCLNSIHAEYGMTELLSQAYAMQEGRFKMPLWMRVLVREEDDPLAVHSGIATGGINIIDLANIYSCAFIATEDSGRLHGDGTFEVLGRLDHAEVRGCSLLAL